MALEGEPLGGAPPGRRGIPFFATAAKGTEPGLRDELRELRLRGVRADRGGVHFAGELHDGFRACLESRIAVRILAEVGAFDARDGDALYAGVRAIDWAPYLTADRTLAVKATTRSTGGLVHSRFVEQKTKDAVVDQLRERLGRRPSVDLVDPDLRIAVRVHDERATVYVDLSGESLHRRGWRTLVGEASLKETLAAALLRMSGWDRASPLVDPMCGAGTIAIEAATWARDLAPGLSRKRFGFERWPLHDATLQAKIRALREAAQARVRAAAAPIVARDVDRHALELARRNAEAAGVSVVFEHGEVRDLAASAPPGTIVTNPPWGDRLQPEATTYRDLGDTLARLRDHAACVLAGTPDIERAIRRKPARTHVVFNGPIECRALVYLAG
ncbi:MAG: THUMP domain-containing protein [Polyangiales bacterium]